MSTLTELLRESLEGKLSDQILALRGLENDELNEALDMKDLCKRFSKLSKAYNNIPWNEFHTFIQSNLNEIAVPDMTKTATIQFLISGKSGDILEIFMTRPAKNGTIDGIVQVDFYEERYSLSTVNGYKNAIKKWRGRNSIKCYEIPIDIAKSIWPRSTFDDKIGVLNEIR